MMAKLPCLRADLRQLGLEVRPGAEVGVGARGVDHQDVFEQRGRGPARHASHRPQQYRERLPPSTVMLLYG